MPRLAAEEPVWALPYSDSLGEAAKPRDWRDMTCTTSEPDERSTSTFDTAVCPSLAGYDYSMVAFKKILGSWWLSMPGGDRKNTGVLVVKSRAVSMFKFIHYTQVWKLEFMNHN